MTSVQALEKARALRDKRAEIMRELSRKHAADPAGIYEAALIEACQRLDAATLMRTYATAYEQGYGDFDDGYGTHQDVDAMLAQADKLEKGQ